MRGLVVCSTERATSLAKVEPDVQRKKSKKHVLPPMHVVSRTDIIMAKTREKDRSYDGDKAKYLEISMRTK